MFARVPHDFVGIASVHSEGGQAHEDVCQELGVLLAPDPRDLKGNGEDGQSGLVLATLIQVPCLHNSSVGGAREAR